MARILWAALCVAVFACVWSFPVRAQLCIPVDLHIAQVKEQPAVVDTLRMDGDKLQKVISYVQAINGDSGKYNTGYIAWSADHVALFLGQDELICVVFVGPISHLPRMLEAAEGRPA